MRNALQSLTLGFAVATLAACADAPTGPTNFDGGPNDGRPQEVVAQVGTIASVQPIAGFGAGGVTATNNRREMAGWNYTTGTAYHAFFRAANGTMTDLGTLGGTGSIGLAINDSSSVVGLSYAANGKYHAFVSRDSSTRVMRDLGTLPGGDRSAAYGINLNGVVVGFSFNSTGKQHAVRWSPPSYAIEDLGTLVGGSSSFAYAINDGGTIVGFALSATGDSRAFKWTSAATGLVDLGTLGGTSATARAINNAGDIVGWSTTLGGSTHAWKKPAAASILTDLGTTSGPSYAFDINTAGQVIGWAQPSVGKEQAILWNGAVNDLGTSATSTSAQALAMNDSGQVVGTSGTEATVWFLNSNTKPTAIFTHLAHSKVNQTSEEFDGSASTDPENDALTYSWTFGDTGSSSNTATGAAVSHLYTTKGKFDVTLTVTDWRGASASSTQTIHIN